MTSVNTLRKTQKWDPFLKGLETARKAGILVMRFYGLSAELISQISTLSIEEIENLVFEDDELYKEGFTIGYQAEILRTRFNCIKRMKAIGIDEEMISKLLDIPGEDVKKLSNPLIS